MDSNSSVFKIKRQEPAGEPKQQNVAAEEVTQAFVKEEVPYSEYMAEAGKPYLADRFDLGDVWEVYGKELGLLDGFIDEKIQTGEIANSTKAVEKLIKKMEKMNNLKDEERVAVKLGILAKYVKFLSDTSGIKMTAAKYGNT